MRHPLPLRGKILRARPADGLLKLSVKVVEGPNTMVDKIIPVFLTQHQLDTLVQVMAEKKIVEFN